MTNWTHNQIYAAKPQMYLLAGSAGVVALSSNVPAAVAPNVRARVGRAVPWAPRRAVLRVQLVLLGSPT